MVTIVRLEKHRGLKSGKHLHTLVLDISKNIDYWLKRHRHKSPIRQDSASQHESQVRNLRYEGAGYSGSRGAWRGWSRPGRGARGNFSQPQSDRSQDANRFCPGCNYLSKELHLDINFRHFPAECPRKQSVLRLLTAAEEHCEEEDNGGKQDNEGKASNDTSVSKPALFNKVWKAKSPTLTMSFHDRKVQVVIDEGSEVSAINQSLVENLNLVVSRTVDEAMTAGSLPLQVTGKTNKDVILHSNDNKVTWNLGQCLVIQNLGCDILIGEPGKVENKIITNPITKSVATVNDSLNKAVLSYDQSSPQSSSPVSEKHATLQNDTKTPR